MTGESASERAPQPFSVGPVEIRIATWVYATVSLMSILVVFDGWRELKSPAGIVIVVVGPTIALGVAHVFADVLQHHVVHGRAHRRHEVVELGWDLVQYLLVAVPPLLVFAVSYLVLDREPSQSIQSMLLLGAASLGFWGGLAGWRTGYRGWRLLLAVAAGLFVGMLVFAFQLVLKPH
jgi:hypothetical protein